MDFGEFKGAPYGGVPVPTGATTSAQSPEISLWARAPIGDAFSVGAQAMEGTRRIVPRWESAIDDTYTRSGIDGAWNYGRFQLQGEQWWGRDFDADGFGTLIGSSGGYVRGKYYIGDGDHAYVAVRYDAHMTTHHHARRHILRRTHDLPTSRIVFQQVQTIGSTGSFGGALTIAIPLR